MSSPVRTIPPLRDGERLTREEFELRYHAMPEVKKAELIDGVVHMPSPVHALAHGNPHGQVVTWLGVYSAATPGVMVFCDTTTRILPEGEPQPDAMLVRVSGGTAHLDPDDYVAGCPELVAEVAASSVSIDRGAKRRDYERAGVQEYVLFLMEEERVEWYILRNQGYELVIANSANALRSEVFPGLWLDTDAFFQRNLAQVLTTLQQGLASPEHAAFVTQLAGGQP